ncbi:MAG: hypothetical protein GC180_06420 [Bacteroidetes bacterium]|nr:hypothetical protein [Bacteroidota bacterium]
MKKYVLFGLLCLLITSVMAQQSSLLRVSSTETDVAQATNYYYSQFSRQVDQLIAKSKIQVYRDVNLKEKIQADQFMKETLLKYTAQIIDPLTPEDPYNLIDTILWENQAISTSEFLIWKGEAIEVSTKNLEGSATYYLSNKEVQKQVAGKAYQLISLYSTHFGQVNSESLTKNSQAFLKLFTNRLFNSESLTPFTDATLKKEMKKEDLNKSRTYNWGDRSVTYFYYPLNADSANGLVMSYETDEDEDAFELENQAVSLMYHPGNGSGAMSWYWSSFDSVKKLYSDQEWTSLMAIQSYSIKKKINRNFEYLE